MREKPAPPNDQRASRGAADAPGATRLHLGQALAEAAATLEAFRSDPAAMAALTRFVEFGAETFRQGGQILACGNGGSMAQAMHFAEEWTGRFRADRQALPAIALCDPSQITCIANDFGFEEVFARQVDALGRPGDLLVLLSTSGASPNILRAARRARERGLRTAALLGRSGGKVAAEVDLPIVVPEIPQDAATPTRESTSDRVQEVHLQILHAMIEGTERMLFPENYAD